MSMIKGLTVLCCVALCSQNLFAQHRQMSIAELFRLADENSTEIAVYRTAAEMAEEGLKAAKAQRLPQIDISASASYIGNGYLWDRDFTNGMKVDMPHFGNNFAVEASQVIYAGGAVESGVQMADLGRQMAGLDLQKRTQDVRFLVLGHYLDLYKLNNQIRVLEHNLELTDKVIVEMHARREQGTVLKNDITRYELQKETLKLQKIRLEDAAKIINHRLVTVLHLPDSTVIVPDSTLLASEVETLTEEFWQNEAVESNLDLKQSELNVQMKQQGVRLERSAMLPQIAVVAADHLDGPILIEVPVLNNNFNYWYVGIGIKYDLSSLFKSRQKVRQARLDLRQAEESEVLARENVENAVQAGYVDFLTSFSNLRTGEKTVELADENYAVVSNRYDNELALLTDMIDASNIKLSAGLDLENARINVIYNYYKMLYLTHTLSCQEE